MANAWFRLYSEFATDPKIQRMSETDQRRFIMLLCMRCSNGDVTLHDDDVSFQLRISNEDWNVTKAVFLSKNLIDDDNLPVAWDQRQFVSDSSAPRVAKHRAKMKESCNVTVTPQNRTEQNRTEETKAVSPVGFTEFWIAYPKKVGKGAAEAAWKKLKPSLSDVLHAISAQSSSDQWRKDGGQFVPNPATWLNQRRWEDGQIASHSGVTSTGPKKGDIRIINGVREQFWPGLGYCLSTEESA